EVVQRVPGEEEADGLDLFAQPVCRNPGLGRAQLYWRLRVLRAAEQVVLTIGARLDRAITGSNHAIDIGIGCSAIDTKLVEGARRGKRLERTLVDEARIDPPREIGEVAARSLRVPLLAKMLDCMPAAIPKRRKRRAPSPATRN